MSESQRIPKRARWLVTCTAVLVVLWPMAPVGLYSVEVPKPEVVARWFTDGGVFMFVLLVTSIAQAVFLGVRGRKHLSAPRSLWPLLVLPLLSAVIGIGASQLGNLEAAGAITSRAKLCDDADGTFHRAADELGLEAASTRPARTRSCYEGSGRARPRRRWSRAAGPLPSPQALCSLRYS